MPLFATEAEALAASGEVFRHYKGGIYHLLHRGVKHTETDEVGVVYEHLWPNPHGVYFRPEAVFFGSLEDGTPRFARIPASRASTSERPTCRVDAALLDELRKALSRLEHPDSYPGAATFAERQVINAAEAIIDNLETRDQTMSVDVAAAHAYNGCTCGHPECPCPTGRPRTAWKGSAGEIARAVAAVQRLGTPVWDPTHEELLMLRLSHPAKLRRLFDQQKPDMQQRIAELDASLRVQDGRGLGLLLTDGFSVWRPNTKTTNETDLREAYRNRRGEWLRVLSPKPETS